jgi:hypothetical protein
MSRTTPKRTTKPATAPVHCNVCTTPWLELIELDVRLLGASPLRRSTQCRMFVPPLSGELLEGDATGRARKMPSAFRRGHLWTGMPDLTTRE